MTMMPRILLLTIDPHEAILRATLHLLYKRWKPAPQVIVAGYKKPDFLRDEQFISAGDFQDFPANRWSDALRFYLDQIPDEYIIIMLEDYWLIRDVDTDAIEMIYDYILRAKDDTLLRFDLSSDRENCAFARDVFSLGRLDIIETLPPETYQVSLQSGIWNTKLLKQMLVDGETPWQFELDGSQRISNTGWRVLGTRQTPVRVRIVINKGEFDLVSQWQYPQAHLCRADYDELHRLGMV